MFDRIKEALVRKLGPQPAWAWLSELAGGLYLYRKHQANTAAAGASTTAAALPAASDYTGTGGYAPASSSPTDSGGLAAGDQSQPGSTSSPPVVYDPLTDSYLSTIAGELATQQTPPPDTTPTATPTTTPPGTIGNQTVRPRYSQPVLAPGSPGTVPTLTGGNETPFIWGGRVFVTKQQFQDWAKAHGTSVARELAKHPEASRLYGQLETGGQTQTLETHPPARSAPVRPRSTPSTEKAAPAAAKPRTYAPTKAAPRPAAKPARRPAAKPVHRPALKKPAPRVTRRGI